MAAGKLQSKDIEDFAMTATTGPGMRFISGLLDYCGINVPSFNPDIGVMSFKEGKRDVGLWVLSMVKMLENGQELLIAAEKYRTQLFMEDEKDGKNGSKGQTMAKNIQSAR